MAHPICTMPTEHSFFWIFVGTITQFQPWTGAFRRQINLLVRLFSWRIWLADISVGGKRWTVRNNPYFLDWFCSERWVDLLASFPSSVNGPNWQRPQNTMINQYGPVWRFIVWWCLTPPFFNSKRTASQQEVTFSPFWPLPRSTSAHSLGCVCCVWR